jgi:hypothetical protein
MTDNLDAVQLPWDQVGWLDEIRLWITSALTTNGLQITGPLEQFHIRPWSTVVRIPTLDGLCYFKASSPALGCEAALTHFLASRFPQLSPSLIAVDPQRGWLLMRDSGTALRAIIRAQKSVQPWQTILPIYAGLQKSLAPQVDTILKLRVMDRRLEILPSLFAELLGDPDCLMIDQPDGLAQAELDRLYASIALFAAMCQRLSSYGIPATLHHDDLHDGNIFISNGQAIFTDWGESAVTHPFFSLVVMLRGTGNTLNLPPEAPELVQMRDWYLQQWLSYAPLGDLQPIVALAEQIGLVNRALTWRHLLKHIPAAQKPSYASAVPAYLQDFLAALPA